MGCVDYQQRFVVGIAAVVVIRKGKQPVAVPYARLPKEIFVWQDKVRNYDINSDLLDLGPHGVWWDFMQNTSSEFVEGTCLVNHGMHHLVDLPRISASRLHPTKTSCAIPIGQRGPTETLRAGRRGKGRS